MRGRAWEVPIYPFSFAEALQHWNREIPVTPDFLSSKDRGQLEWDFTNWLEAGGFPEAQNLKVPTRQIYL